MFDRLVRFKDSSGKIQFGEAGAETDLLGATVQLYEGKDPWSLKPSDQSSEIAEVLCPLPSTPIVYGVGLNYKHHIAESGFPTPKCPTIFTKPPAALAGPHDTIAIHPECKNMDYEGELCIITSRDFKNLSLTANPLDYILGFAAGNDVSSRYWQAPEQSGNQAGYAKSFDGFAPIGPVIASPRLPAITSKYSDGVLDLKLTTRVNGDERQNSRTSDLLFGVGEILRHLSRGTTVRRGTVIMTGTPAGVAAFMKPPAWLKDGDVVEIEIEGIGMIKNKMVFE